MSTSKLVQYGYYQYDIENISYPSASMHIPPQLRNNVKAVLMVAIDAMFNAIKYDTRSPAVEHTIIFDTKSSKTNINAANTPTLMYQYRTATFE